jgi:Lon protease-like protein
MDLLVRGTRRFRITARPPDDPYPIAEVAFLDEPLGPRPDEALRLARSALERYAGAASRRSGEPMPEVSLPRDPVAASYAAAAMLAIDGSALQKLLEQASASERLASVAALARAESALLDAVGLPLNRPPLEGTSFN